MSALRQSPIRVFVVDDHQIVRAGLEMLFLQHPGFVMVGQAGSKREALAHDVGCCDVILLDLDLNGESGLELIPDLLRLHDEAKILILTGSRDPDAGRQAVAHGAMGIVLKDHSPDRVLKAIECIHRGEFWMDRSLTASIISGLRDGPGKVDPDQAKIALLTAREREVVNLIGEGLKNKEIASRLFLSETTVRHHLTSIFSKLEVSDRLELVIYAYRHNLISQQGD